jgi:hypothetical protein
MTTYVSLYQNFGIGTADPELVTTGTTQTPSADVCLWINTTNLAAPDGASTPISRSEVRRIVENLLNYLNDGRQAVLPGV